MPPLNSKPLPVPPMLEQAPNVQQGMDPNILQALRMSAMQSQGPPPAVQGWAPAQETPVNTAPQMIEPLPMMEGNQVQSPNEGGFTFNPETRASDEFMALMENYPERDIGVLERIAASMLGATNPQLALQHLRAPTPEQVEWKNRAGVLGSLAREERMGNRMGQQYEIAKMRDETQRETLAEKERHNKSVEDLRRAALEKPYLQMYAEPGGTVKMINTRTGDVVDTGVDSGKLTDIEKINMNAADRLEQLDAQAQAAMERTQATVSGAAERTRMQQTGADTRAAATRTTGRTPSALDQRRQFSNAARQWMLDNPELAQNGWITIDGEDVSVMAPGEDSSGIFGMGATDRPTQQEYDAMLADIRGRVAAMPTGPTATQLETGTTPTQATGRVRVRNLETGQVGTISEEALAAYPEKYERVQ